MLPGAMSSREQNTVVIASLLVVEKLVATENVISVVV
jgi:hypothetical protein